MLAITAPTGLTRWVAQCSPLTAKSARTISVSATPTTSFFSIPIGRPGGSGPNQGRFGTLGRDTFRGPALHNLDVALTKDTHFIYHHGREPMELQFRAEIFNAFNLVNFGLPSNVLVGSGFGNISQTAGPSRQIQFSLKLLY